MDIYVTFTAQLPIEVTEREKWFLASCPVLDVHSQGETEEEARNNLTEALSLFFISCFERGTLDDVLKECGFSPIHPPAAPEQRPTVSREDYIDVPIPFLVGYKAKDQCHV